VKQIKLLYKFYNAIRKYGDSNFEWEIIDTASSKKELDKKEAYYIEQYNSYEDGYNSTKEAHGGFYGPHSDESKKKMSKAQSGKHNGFYGKTHTKEVISSIVSKLKTPYKEVKQIIENNNYVLITLEDEYENVRQKLHTKCPNGHDYYVMFYAFKNGNRCKCELSKKTRTSYDELKQKFDERNYKLLTKKEDYYKDNNMKIVKVKCDKGHVIDINRYNFINGHGCGECYRESRGKK
jgi:predicted transcriptional regulator